MLSAMLSLKKLICRDYLKFAILFFALTSTASSYAAVNWRLHFFGGGGMPAIRNKKFNNYP